MSDNMIPQGPAAGAEQGVPDPQLQTPDAAQIPAAPAAPAQQQPTPSPTAAPTTHSSKWLDVVKGALSGLALGGIPGAVGGAIDPTRARAAYQRGEQEAQTELQQKQANVKFTSLQSANAVADAKYKQAQIDQMPAELKVKQDEQALKTAQMFQSAGIYPTVVAPNTSDGASAALQQVQDAHGAVPELVFLHLGDHIVGYDPTVMSSNTAVLDQVNNYQRIVGGPQFNPASLKNAANKTQVMQSAADLFHPSFPGMDKAQGLISRYDGMIKSVGMWPDDDPRKADNLEKLKDARKNVADAYDARNADQMKAAQARGEAAQNAKAVEVYNPATGQMELTAAGQAKAQHLATSSTVKTALSQEAMLDDISNGGQLVRKAVQGLDKSFSPAQIGMMNRMLRSEDSSVAQSVADSLISRGLTPSQNSIVNAMLQIHERSVSLRTVYKQGQSSDKLRGLVSAMLPNLADLNNRDLLNKKLDSFDQQVSIARKAIPNYNKGASAPASGGQEIHYKVVNGQLVKQ